ncbi:MAG: phosphoribosylamine--glycine ligase, partial [Patescibacteria group bacterium]|nr:phosphoribosylamine--glycine ligase [Patescibacteria group bacterium]
MVAVIGTGNREKALAEVIKKSPRVRFSYLLHWTSVDEVTTIIRDRRVDLVIIGPEAPLVAGLVDKLKRAGIPAVGPTAAAARLEGSKFYGRVVAGEAGVPIPKYRVVHPGQDIERIVRDQELPVVVKRDGLADGKGVSTTTTAEKTLAKAREELLFGSILLEERLVGREISVFFACDGVNAVFIGAACDKKRLLDGDEGPNTGGMGAFSLALQLSDDLLEQIKRRIAPLTLAVMRKRGCPYHGILYLGLMLVEVNGAIVPYLIEYNCRFGDPEAQVILPLMDCDIMDYLLGTLTEGGLEDLPPMRFRPGAAICVSIADKEYPTKGHRLFSVVGTGATHALAGQDAYEQIERLK